MKAPLQCTAFVLALVLTGCFHRQPQPAPQPVAPELAQTPPPAPSVPAASAPTQETLPPTQQPAVESTPATPAPAPAEEPAQPHHKKHAEKPATDQATTPETPAVEAIGQLSTGSSSAGAQQVKASIDSTENGLKQITRALNDQEQKTATQIREFIKQARAALDSSDADGASTLALKAKVLLDELSQ